MDFLMEHFKWVMLVSAALTLSLLLAVVSPRSAMLSTFGETLEGPLADILIRNWGGLVAIMGGLLAFGAFDPPSRPLVLVAAGLSKVLFIGLVLSHRDRFFKGGARFAVIVDLILVAMFAAYLVAVLPSAQ